ncbi:MAG: methyltransferase domain-containing protein [Patescibacteria group bacterium]
MKKKQKVTDYSKYPPHLASVTPVVKLILRYKKRGTVLDLGSGGGRHAYFLAKHGFTVTVLDKNQGMLARLKRAAKQEIINLIYQRADIAKPHFTKKYDVIVAAVSLHFLKPAEISRAIVSMKAHTKRGGLNAITVHTMKNKKTSTKPYRFKKSELRNYYTDWKIHHYRELWGDPFRLKPGARFIRRHRAELIAEKQ